MRKSPRAPSPPSPPSQPSPAEDAGFGLHTMFDHDDHHKDVLTAPAGSDARPDRAGRRTGRLVVGAVCLGVVLVAAAAVAVRATVDHPSTAATASSPRPDIGSPPAELPATGSAIRSQVGADGDVEVTQWIRSRFPVTDLGVQTPPDGAGTARVGDITVVADGEPVAPLRDTADPTLRFSFGVPAKLVYLRYVLTRAVEDSPSVPGRALVRTAFLRVDYRPQQGPTVVTVIAPEVSSMTCSDPEEVISTPRPCGSPTEGGWRVTLRDSDRPDDVMAQVDLRP